MLTIKKSCKPTTRGIPDIAGHDFVLTIRLPFSMILPFLYPVVKHELLQNQDIFLQSRLLPLVFVGR